MANQRPEEVSPDRLPSSETSFPPNSALAGGFRIIEHPADIGIAFWSNCREKAFEQAVRGLTALLGGRVLESAKRFRFHWTVPGRDDIERCFGLLDRVLFEFDAYNQMIISVTVSTPTSAQAPLEAWGELTCADLTEVPYYVKAVTYHQLEVEHEGAHWHGRVYFDI